MPGLYFQIVAKTTKHVEQLEEFGSLHCGLSLPRTVPFTTETKVTGHFKGKIFISISAHTAALRCFFEHKAGFLLLLFSNHLDSYTEYSSTPCIKEQHVLLGLTGSDTFPNNQTNLKCIYVLRLCRSVSD